MLAKRRQLDRQWVECASQKILELLRDWEQYGQAKTIMLYLSMPDEPQTNEIIQLAWSQGKKVCVPHLTDKFGIMEAALIHSLDDLVIGRLGLRLPAPSSLTIVDPKSIDFILVPGVAFDRDGQRLGMGAGYYDRFLSRTTQATLTGMAWSFQVTSQVPVAEHDIVLDYLLTEEGIQTCGQGKM